MKLNLLVSSSYEGTRLDKFLGLMEEVGSRSRALQLIDAGLVHVNGRSAKASLLLKGGERVEIEIPAAEPTELQPLDLKLDFLHEDEHLLVLNKPPGLVVHPAAGHAQDTLVNALIAHTESFSMKFGEVRPGIVHRLDKDTSGVMVIAKTDAVLEALAQQFKSRSIHRHYLAVVWGQLPKDFGSIKSFLARHPIDRKRFASVRDQKKKIIQDFHAAPGVGKWAHTDFWVLARHNSGLTYLKLKLHTGRTHQIRVHLSEMGFPILGDEIYGGVRKQREVPRLALHAAELGFLHPVTKQEMFFRTPWPEDYHSIVEQLFGGKGV